MEIRRKPPESFDEPPDYFLATAVRRQVAGDAKVKIKPIDLTTEQDRHLLVASFGPWVFYNVHAESGGTVQKKT